MANILSLAMKINADASGVVKNLTPAERALEQLGQAASKTTTVFSKFAKDSAAAASAQDSLNKRFADLAQQLQGGLNAREYAAQFAALQQEVRETADAFEEGARVTRELRTEQEIHAERMARLNDLVRLGAISGETYARGVAQADAALARASKSADTFADQTERAKNAGLKFNEISGIFAALPGPLGNIAGRLSGITSAAQGLQRVFTGDIYANLASLGTAASSLINPFTAAAAAAAALGAGAIAVGRNLLTLEAEVERLTQLADRLGVSFEFIQVLQVASVKTGTSVDQLGGSFNRFLKSVNDARNGSSAAVSAFGDLGLSIADVQSSTPEQLFTDVAAAVGQIEDPAQRAAVAMQLFGKAGLELLPVFDELATAREELERLGAAISDRQREQVARFGDELDRAAIAAKGFGDQTSAAFANTAGNVTRGFTEITAATNRFSQQNEVASQSIANSVANQLPIISQLNLIGSSLSAFGNDAEQSASSASRIAEALEETQSQAESLQKLLDGVTQSVSDAIDESAAFGQAGFDAAYRYQEAIRDLKEQLDRGMINEETFRRSAEQAGDLFQQEINTIEQEAEIELRVKQDAEQAIAKVRAELSKAIDESAAFGQAGFDAAVEYQRAVDELQRQFEAGIISETVLAREAERAQAAYEAQVDAAKELIENDKKRIDSLLKSNDAAAQVRDDLDAVSREQARVSELLADPLATNDQISAAQERLRELEQLQDSLADQAQAASQGFSEGFDKAFESTNSGLTSLIVKAEEFGPAGAAAAEQLRAGIELAQNQAAGGIISKEAYDLEVERQKQLFNNRLQQEEEIAKARLKQEEEVNKTLFAAAYGYNSERIKAAETYAILVDEMLVTEEAIAAARADGNQEEVAALSQRLQALDQAAAREEDIASGRAKAREEEEKRIKKIQEDTQKQGEKAREEYLQQQTKIFEEQRKAAEAEFKRQQERLKKLNTLGDQSISVGDVRTVEGANLVIQTAAQGQDPALIQQRLQTKYLEQIAFGINQAAGNFFNQPVAIVGPPRPQAIFPRV